jgi:hypothetical protein
MYFTFGFPHCWESTDKLRVTVPMALQCPDFSPHAPQGSQQISASLGLFYYWVPGQAGN